MSMWFDRRIFLGRVGRRHAACWRFPVARARRRKLGKVEYGVASIDPLYAAAYVALKRDLFKQQGLEVNYLNTQSGPRSKQLLAAGQITVATSGRQRRDRAQPRRQGHDRDLRLRPARAVCQHHGP